MKKLILASLALLMVAAGPAMAGEFQALSKLSVPGQTALTVMTDDQLAKVEGQGRNGRHGGGLQLNLAFNTQINVCGVCVGVVQINAFSQSND
jgi:hypothetical protein